MARLRIATATALLAVAGQAWAQAPAQGGGEIRNTARLHFQGPAAGGLQSNTVTLALDTTPQPVPDALLLTMVASVRTASAGDRVTYRLQLTNRGAATASGVHLIVTLPPGLRAVGGGRTLDLPMVPLPAGVTIELRGLVIVDADAPAGEAVARGVARIGGAVASNEAAAAVAIDPLLFTDAITVLGEVRRGPCGTPGTPAAGVRLLTENGLFAITDADGRYHLEAVKPGRHVVQLDPASLAGAPPLLCADDTRAAGGAASRFVEANGGMVARADFRIGASAAPPTTAPSIAPTATPSDTAFAAGDRDWLRGQAPGIALLFPGPSDNPRAPVTRVVVKHRPGQRVALQVGGRPVDPLSFDATDVDAARDVAVSRWSGIPLDPGVNAITALVLDADGHLVQQLDGSVTLSGPPARATLDAAHSRLVADGVHPAVVAVRIVDGAGRPVRDGTVVRFTVDAPYAAAGDAALDQRRALAGQGAERTARVTGDAGIAEIALAPTARAGAVHLTVVASGDPAARPSDVRAWLDAAAQGWVVVGFADGTLGHDLLAAHREEAAGEGPVTDGRLAFYARGRIKGSWLLTVAYDSKRLRAPDAAARGTIDPNRYYTVYGDASRQGEDASGGGMLYVRVEAHAFYALFGDIETGFGDTQLLRYVRTVDGVKAAYEGRTVRASGFVARPSSRHVRDDLRGLGITGPYRLSARPVVPDSDGLAIEVRDRDHLDRIVSRTPLARHVDYEIDDVTGTVRLHAPLLSTDAARNPVFLVAEYESDGAPGRTIAGARVAATLGALEIGATVVREEGASGGAGAATLAGIDVTARIDPATVLRVEAGAGGAGGLRAGQALLAEVEHHDRIVDVHIAARQQTSGYGVGQQGGAEAGSRSLALDARARLAPRTTLVAKVAAQDRLDGGATRDTGSVAFEQARDHGSVSLGVEGLRARTGDAPWNTAARLKLGGSRALADGALIVSGEAQLGLRGADGAFPLRQRIDASYRVAPALRVAGGYEHSAAGDTARAGLDLTPWTGASLSGTVNRLDASEDGARLYAVYGIDQTLRLGRRWTLDATLDSSRTVAGAGAGASAVVASGPADPADPFGAGPGADAPTEDFLATTFGAAYRAAAWSWTGRIEYRDAATATRIALTSAVVRALGAGRTLGASVRASRSTGRSTGGDGVAARTLVADLALALRPPDSRWSLLDRLELRAGRDDVAAPPGADTTGDETRAVNNFALDFRSVRAGEAGNGFSASLYYGAKYGGAGLVDVTGLALRHDLAAWLDIGVQASVQHGWMSGTLDYSAGPSLGVSPARGLWISGGYNLAGVRDADFSGTVYARGGPFLTLRSKFDQSTLGLGK